MGGPGSGSEGLGGEKIPRAKGVMLQQNDEVHVGALDSGDISKKRGDR